MVHPQVQPQAVNTSSARAIPVAAFALAATVLLLWLTLPAAPAGFDWDDTWYLWMAEWYSGRAEYRDVAWLMMQARQYPPLFPYLLSHSGEVLNSHASGLIMNAVFLAAGAAVAMHWLMERGVHWVAAATGSAMIIISPVALTFIPTLMSEPLFILVTTVALALAASGSERWPTWLLIGLLAGLSVATRSAGWALVGGLVISLLISRRFRSAGVLLPGLAVGLLVHFSLKSGLPVAHSYLEGFVENFRNIDVSYLVGQGRALVAGWLELWGSVPGAVAMGVLVLPGFLIGLKRGRAEAWYIAVSLGMLIAWPFPGQMGRFLWVLLPAALAVIPLTVELLRRKRDPELAVVIVISLAVLLSVPGGIARDTGRLINPPGNGLNDLSRLADWTRPADRDTALMNLRVRRQLLDDAARIETLTGNLQCIHSELPALVSIRAKRIAFASPWNTLAEVGAVQGRCRYYYLVPDALPGTDARALQKFSETHQELFRSTAPWDDSGESSLGIFYRLEVGSE